MPAERTAMRHVREVLRLKFVGGVPTREIARRIGVAPSTVRTTIRRFQAAGLSWPLPDEMTDAALEARLFPDAGTKASGGRSSPRPEPGNSGHVAFDWQCQINDCDLHKVVRPVRRSVVRRLNRTGLTVAA